MRDDLRAALRSLTASKAYAATTVAVLALGIGATAAMFSIAYGVMFRALPFPDSDRLVTIKEFRPPEPADEAPPVLPQNYLDWASRQDVFDAMAAVAPRLVTLTDADGSAAEDQMVVRATAGLFDVLSYRPQLGRVFGAEHEVAGRDRVVVLSHAVWQRRYGSAPDVVGRVVLLDRQPYEVIGVLSPAATFDGGALRGHQVVVPLVFDGADRVRQTDVSRRYLSTVARLAAGTRLEPAQARMDQIAAGLRAEHPAWNDNHHVLVRPLIDSVVGSDWRAWLWLLFGSAATCLAIAGVNVAVLQLARATARQREWNVRLALGGNRWRLTRPLLVENLLLSAAGTLVAVVIAYLGIAAFKTAIPGRMARLDELRLDVTVLGAMAAIGVVVGIGIGLVPALTLSTARASEALHDAPRPTADPRSRRRSRRLMAAELTLALLLLVAVNLFVRSYQAVVGVDLGFDPASVFSATLTPPPRADGAGPTAEQFSAGAGTIGADLPRLEAFVANVAVRPGVASVAYAMPGGVLGAATFMSDLVIDGRALGDDAQLLIRRVTPDYHRTLRIGIVEGRALTAADRPGDPPVGVVNRAAVRRFFAGRSPLGAVIVVGGVPHRVVGVMADARQLIEGDVEPEFSVPLWGGGRALRGISGQLLVRAADIEAVRPFVEQASHDLIPEAPLRNLGSLEGALDRAWAWRRFDMQVISLFGVLGLVISAVGVYGSTAYGVERRQREMGVRIALGAAPRAVLGLVLRETAGALMAGLAAGGGLAWWLSAAVERHLYGVPARDAWSFVMAGTVLAAVALVAAARPAWRAASTDAAAVLRAE